LLNDLKTLIQRLIDKNEWPRAKRANRRIAASN
jgi:hypothetical protein